MAERRIRTGVMTCPRCKGLGAGYAQNITVVLCRWCDGNGVLPIYGQPPPELIRNDSGPTGDGGDTGC